MAKRRKPDEEEQIFKDSWSDFYLFGKRKEHQFAWFAINQLMWIKNQSNTAWCNKM